VLYGPFDHTRDTHGNQASFRRGFDGWLYCTHGYNNDSHVKGRDGHEVHLNSGNTYRLRLDGSRIEQYTHGQVNPFGLAFDPLGDLFSSDCHSAPIYQLLEGAYYPSFGKPHDGLGFAPTMMEKARGSTALDGINYYADDLWPEEFRDNIFIGDVMNSRVFRDRAVEVGATKIARPLPDFLTTEDAWFRPVDTQLGPDGALYIADFYNRIIGHYEVPLTHPGRDRTSGRIWRVTYRGTGAQPKLHSRRDLSQASAKELVAELAHPNLTRRRLAADELVDRIGAAAVPVVKQSLATSQFSPFHVIHCLWVLQRLGALDEKMIAPAAKSEDRSVRVHAQRIVAATTPRLSPALRELALAGLKDSDGLVQRCAAEALANHSSYENIEPLLALRDSIPPQDTHLLYVARKALRDQLLSGENFARLAESKLREQDARAIADVAVAVPSEQAGSFLLHHIQTVPEPQDTLTSYIRHAARYVPAAQVDELAKVTREKFSADADMQLALFKSVQEGTRQRGVALSPGCREWGAELAEKLLNAEADSSWHNTPLEGMSDTRNPWFIQKRVSADGDTDSRFLCSLPPGGERLTGVLRSKPFTLPVALKFFLAGHDGYPDKPAQKKNVVRLRDAKTHEVLEEKYPPRNDQAQPVTWDLSKRAGRQGLLEVVDGDNGNAYAWLAIGRFDPPVVSVPRLDPSQIAQRQQAAAELARTLPLPNLEPQLTRLLASSATEMDTRAAAALALLALNPNDQFGALAPLIGDAAVPSALRENICQALAGRKLSEGQTILLEAIRTLSRRLQIKLAQTLAGSGAGAENLLQLVAEGKASPALLQERSVKDKLLAANPPNAQERVATLTTGLTPVSAELQKLIDRRRAGYDPAKASPVKGAVIFTQTCGVCHQIDGQGIVIGPQLDGIGGRGLERLCEDVLDPNRNVDPSFRSTLLTLKDGEVMSGLVRREEPEVVVLADSTGKEISIAKKQITERKQSESSLMPENFGDLLSPDDFNNLMAFLLSKAGKPASKP
jgi:putative heme-binding domain-containing protein